MPGDFVPVLRVEELPPGAARQVTVDGQWIGLFNVHGTFHAIDNLCLHRGGPLADGPVRYGIVTCPWHGWQFHVATGACVQDPSVGVTRHDVRVVDGVVQVRLCPP